MSLNTITLLDAGMGKALSGKGVAIPETIWSANALIVAPEAVVEIHRENILAGANIITTNSYGVIRSDLAKEGIEDQYPHLNQMAGILARQAINETGSDASIAGSLPPLNGSYRPDRVLEESILFELYREQVRELDDYVDLFLCETMSSIAEATVAARAASESGKPVVVALTLHDEKPACLRSGETIEQAMIALDSLNPLGVVANCCLPERISDAMATLVQSPFLLKGGYANGFSRVPQDWLLDGSKESDGRLVLRDDLDPSRYAHVVSQWLAQGANFVGGCCGTTAEHTAAIRAVIK